MRYKNEVNKRDMNMKDRKYLVIGLIITMVLSLGCLNQSNSQPTTSTGNVTTENVTAATLSNQLKEGAPIQNSIKAAVQNGSLSLKDMSGPPEYSSQILANNQTDIKIKYTTKLTFKNPKGAGISSNKWPKFQIASNSGSNLQNSQNGNIQNGNVAINSNANTNVIDYDQQIKDSISSDIKNITNNAERTDINNSWNNYSFDSGERTYEINETYDGTYSTSPTTFAKVIPIDETVSTSNYNILMGFTEPIHWQYNKEENLYVNVLWWKERIAWVRADVGLYAVLGLRLPTMVGIVAPNQMISGKSYTLSTNIIGQDWSANQYFAANVLPENGNEFVSHWTFSVSAQAWIKVIGNIGPYGITKDLDYGKSFKTPFGPDEKFPIPELIYSPDQTNLKINNGVLWAGVGLRFEPILGSDKITAKWDSGGDLTGNGLIEYNLPSHNYDLGPVNTGAYDKSNSNAIIRLSDYNYYFNICKLDFDANVQGGLTFMPLTIQSPYVTIYSYNCGGITNGIHLGVHRDTNANSVVSYIKVLPTGYLAANSAVDTVTTPTGYVVANSAVVIPTHNIVVTPTEYVIANSAVGHITENPTVVVTPVVTVTESPTTTATPVVTVTENPTVVVTPVVTVTESPTTTATPYIIGNRAINRRKIK